MANSNYIQNKHEDVRDLITSETCSDLDPEQVIMCAELQIIYNKLTNSTPISSTGLFQSNCKAVDDAMEELKTKFDHLSTVELTKKYEDIYVNLFSSST